MCVHFGALGTDPTASEGVGGCGYPRAGSRAPHPPWDTLPAPGAPWSCTEPLLGGDGENVFWFCMWLPGMWGKARAAGERKLTGNNKPEPSSVVAGTGGVSKRWRDTGGRGWGVKALVSAMKPVKITP